MEPLREPLKATLHGIINGTLKGTLNGTLTGTLKGTLKGTLAETPLAEDSWPVSSQLASLVASWSEEPPGPESDDFLSKTLMFEFATWRLDETRASVTKYCFLF